MTQTRWCHTQYDLGCMRMALTMNLSSASSSASTASVALRTTAPTPPIRQGSSSVHSAVRLPAYRVGTRAAMISRR